jgi:hypothetical protein
MTTEYYDVPDKFTKKNVKCGYGMYTMKLDNGRRVYFHSGRVPGIRSEHAYIPNGDLYFSILSNVSVAVPENIKDKVDMNDPNNQIDIEFLENAIINAMGKN